MRYVLITFVILAVLEGSRRWLSWWANRFIDKIFPPESKNMNRGCK